MKKIAIYGAGGFGREVKTLIDQINDCSYEWDFEGYFDDDPKFRDQNINGFPVLGGISQLNILDHETAIVLAIGDSKLKKECIQSINNSKIYYPVLIHPSVIIGDKQNVNIGEGTLITAGNILTVNIEIGNHVMINLDCTIGHDASIGDYCSIMPSVNISGNVKLNEGVYVGTGVKIINNLEIGANSVIGAGAVVIRDIMPDKTYVGNPAKPLT